VLHVEVAGAGERLVLVHGFTQTSASWAPVATDLARDHTVVRVDAPGHGRSREVRADLPHGARLLGEVGGQATYVGYSMGGRLALQLALDQPGLVERLVLVSATAGIENPAERAARRTADEALADDIERDGVDAFLQRWLALPLFAGLSDEAAGLDDRRANTAAGLAASLRLAGTGTMDPPLWGRLDQLRTRAVPVLVVVGENDARFVAIGRRLVDSIGPSATMAVIAGAGHTAHLERPADFLAALRTWLAA
jgi:2-succinyl-6-hydroxy-2,4-cyclohexadiene-1-carboxylate synthase